MAGKREDNTQIERVCGTGGNIDISELGGKAVIGIFVKNGLPYVQVELGGTPYIDDLIGALKRVRRRVAKAEE